MKPAPRQIESILAAAVEVDSEVERREFLEEACAGDAELKRRIEELVENHFRAGSFLEQPAVAPPATDGLLYNNPPTSDPRPVEGPGACIGPYKLLQQIGEGGMGIVYMAEQQRPVRRRVAFKIIKPGMDTAQVIARFEAERQALALMDHQNIAKVFDASTTETGRPYFVMELVHGVPITQFCDANQLTLRERLQLFVPVCQALQHAHQKGIIHRDIKPSNVLVTLYDDKPVPKVIDFGVAKAIEQRLTEKTLFTQFGALVGTFEYMSPEQAEMNALGVDTRSDIYSLGVLLYELLTGTTPLPRERLREAALSELVRLIKEEEPPRPSVRLSSSNSLPKIAAARKTMPAKLSKLVRGEIDWIVMKCLEKDRSRRYETANGLARDVERYLHDEPVEACPPSAGYRLRKFARKYRTPVIVAGLLALLLVAGVVVSTWQAVRATRAEGDAVWQRNRAMEAEGEATMKRQQAEAAQEQAHTAEANAKGEADRARAAEQETRRQWYAASISAMQQAWQSGQVARLRALLTETEAYPDRGFEWYYFQRLCHLDLHTLIGHRAEVLAVSWSPDGKSLATGGRDGTAKVWDAVDGRELLTLHGHMGLVSSVSWSPDSKRLATASDDETVKVWEVASRRELLTLPGHTNGALSVSWSPDGKRLATGSGDGTAKVWDVDSRRELVSLKEDMGAVSSMRWSPDGKRKVSANAVSCVAWSPDGKRLATASGDGNTKVWDAASGRGLLTLRGHRGPVLSVAWSPDGKKLATVGEGTLATEDGTAKVWEAASGQPLLTLQGHTALVRSVSWSPDGKRLAMASAYGTAKVWESASGRELLTLKGHTGLVLSVSWSPDGKALATASEDGTAKVWKADNDRELLTLSGHTSGILITAWSPDGKRLATGHWDGTAKVWEATNGHELLALKGRTTAWSPDGKQLATGNEDGTARVWDTSSGSELLRLQDNTNGLYRVSWSPDGKRLAAASVDGTAKVWEATGQRELSLLRGHTNWLGSVSWSPDGKRLATTSADRTAKIWDAADKRELLTLKGHTGWVFCAPWSPDGKLLATGSRDGTAKVWDAISGQELRTLQGHTAGVEDVCWSPDGKRLATGSLDGTVKVWEAAGWRQLLTLQGRAGGVRSVSWSPDGKRLAAGGTDGMVRVWDAAGAKAVQEWSRQNRALDDLLALNAYRGPQALGFIQTWLLMLPLPWDSAQKGEQALDLQQVEREAQLRPQLGARVTVRGQELLWQEYRAPEAVVDFNAVVGHVTERSVAYAACYLESDRRRNDLWLQIGSDDRAKVYLNGREIYQNRMIRGVRSGLDTIGPVVLEQGTNALLFKVLNEDADWEGCVRLVDKAGRPAKDIRVKLTPE
jgi:WD40 repeat protein/serine/threonine protein kinase